jgi:hypothetical protein
VIFVSLTIHGAFLETLEEDVIRGFDCEDGVTLSSINEVVKSKYQEYKKYFDSMVPKFREYFKELESISVNLFVPGVKRCDYAIRFDGMQKSFILPNENSKYMLISDHIGKSKTEARDFYTTREEEEFIDRSKSILDELSSYVDDHLLISRGIVIPTMIKDFKTTIKHNDVTVELDSQIMKTFNKYFYLTYLPDNDSYELETNILGTKRFLNRQAREYISDKPLGITNKEYLFRKIMVNPDILPTWFRDEFEEFQDKSYQKIKR